MELAFLYIKSNGGIDTEATYPYEARNGKCRFDPKNIGATDRVNLPITLYELSDTNSSDVSGFCSSQTRE